MRETRRQPPLVTVLLFAFVTAVVLLTFIGAVLVEDVAGMITCAIAFVVLGVIWTVLTRGLGGVADIVLTALVAGAFALAAYLLWIGWEDGEGTYCHVRQPCEEGHYELRFVAFIVTLAIGGAIAAWMGRALVATVWLIVVPLATAQVNGDVNDLEYSGLFQLALLVVLVPVLVAVAAVTAVAARLVRARGSRSDA
jgi:hypothetical protein